MRIESDKLPRPGGPRFLTDGGLETTLVFHDQLELPEFASFVLLENDAGRNTLLDYYRRYLDIAAETGAGFVLETATWRANPDWMTKLGYDDAAFERVNRDAVAMLEALRDEYAGKCSPIVVSGNMGPRGDGYVVNEQMSMAEAAQYHGAQIRVFADAGVDVVTAITMTHPGEAAGIVAAANRAGLPSVIGFTTETDGRLPSGATLAEAIGEVDRDTQGGPAYYMINCAHTDHFSEALAENEDWTSRIQGIRANASRLSHAELDEMDVLDDGDPQEFGESYRQLADRMPWLRVFGGCCGTDHRHIQALQQAIG
ncbi:MAG: homocysteine S-methyltransferase family protein [Woeseiaceae bacterium]|nr:homocysteine S-methyltransferase family protein [Woeseiaceae bacterium]